MVEGKYIYKKDWLFEVHEAIKPRQKAKLYDSYFQVLVTVSGRDVSSGLVFYG